MKVGDLVTWSASYERWQSSSGWHNLFYEKGLTRKDKCGIIVNKNRECFYVLWTNGTTGMYDTRDLELIK